METCILIPHELSLILRLNPDPRRPLEMGATLWANKTLTPGMTFGPEDGKIELDTLEIYSELPTDDVSSQYRDTFSWTFGLTYL